MKAIAILDIDDKFKKHYKDFAIDGELIAFFTSSENALWRDGVKIVAKTKLIPFDKHTFKKAGKDFVIYDRNYLFANLDREYELNKTLKDMLERLEKRKNEITRKEI